MKKTDNRARYDLTVTPSVLAITVLLLHVHYPDNRQSLLHGNGEKKTDFWGTLTRSVNLLKM